MTCEIKSLPRATPPQNHCFPLLAQNFPASFSGMNWCNEKLFKQNAQWSVKELDVLKQCLQKGYYKPKDIGAIMKSKGLFKSVSQVQMKISHLKKDAGRNTGKPLSNDDIPHLIKVLHELLDCGGDKRRKKAKRILTQEAAGQSPAPVPNTDPVEQTQILSFSKEFNKPEQANVGKVEDMEVRLRCAQARREMMAARVKINVQQCGRNQFARALQSNEPLLFDNFPMASEEDLQQFESVLFEEICAGAGLNHTPLPRIQKHFIVAKNTTKENDVNNPTSSTLSETREALENQEIDTWLY